MVARILPSLGGALRDYSSSRLRRGRVSLVYQKEVYAVVTEDGILITPYDPNFAKAMEVAERGSKKFRNALRELSK